MDTRRLGPDVVTCALTTTYANDAPVRAGTALAFRLTGSKEIVAMLSNRLALTAVGITCVAAAGGGSYLATRHNAADVAMPTAVADTSAPLSASAPASPSAVQETEALVATPKADAEVPRTDTEPKESRPAAPPATRPAPSSRATRAQTSASAKTAQPPTLERTWPSTAATTPSPLPADNGAAAAREERGVGLETPRAPETPAKTLEELVVSADSVIGLQTETPLSSERARVEDRVEARVLRDVRVGGQVAIPAGTRALGSVTVVERGGKFKERARLGIRFHTLVMADGTRVPITTDTLYRSGNAPGNGSAAKIGGGAVAGAILGAIIGGGKGAAVGATTGAGAGTAAVVTGDRSEATFPAGSELTARILSPVTITVER